MLSGRSTVVAFLDRWCAYVLDKCCERLGLADEGATMELWHDSGERVPGDAGVQDWPGIQPRGEISEYQLLLRQ
eukprot:1921242-Amphidinium_carterae.1